MIDYNKIIDECELSLTDTFKKYEDVALRNQQKVLNAFKKCRVSSSHFGNTTGYGYDDIGKNKLSEVFACTFNTESAIVSPHFASGTHALSTALFGILRPNDNVLCISGMPYDTLKTAIFGKNIGSLTDFDINFEVLPLTNNKFDTDNIAKTLHKKLYKMVYIQRSAGYEQRSSFSIDELKQVIDMIHQNSNAIIIVDNCYGEFVEKCEPSDVGTDVIVGSLIKNPGGSIAPTGAYIAGKKDLIELISMRFTAPGIGTEVGSHEASYRNYFQGFFLAPHVVCQAKKGGALIAEVMKHFGYDVFPNDSSAASDIVKVIKFDNKETMIKFCQEVQASSPIDSFAQPQPWDMPGYSDQIIMASGSFVQGSSIELSADAPVRPPYALYIQGGITYEHTKIALLNCLIATKIGQ